jgi:transcriptional regulator with XRE-family HTH domain
LPELEILAFHLDVPLEHFWKSEVLKPDASNRVVDAEDVKQTRQRAIGDLIQQSRKGAALSIEELSQQAGISVENLQAYEQGEAPIPLPELEIISQVLNNSIVDFEDHQGPVGNWFNDKRNVSEFLDLPQELKEFVSKPINRPYLEGGETARTRRRIARNHFVTPWKSLIHNSLRMRARLNITKQITLMQHGCTGQLRTDIYQPEKN